MKHTKGYLRRRYQKVEWPALLAWARSHGALNDRITSIRIDGRGGLDLSVIIEGWALDNGRPFWAGQNELAKWQTAEPLRFLP